MSKTLTTKVSTPLSDMSNLGPSLTFSFPDAMWLVSVTRSVMSSLSHSLMLVPERSTLHLMAKNSEDVKKELLLYRKMAEAIRTLSTPWNWAAAWWPRTHSNLTGPGSTKNRSSQVYSLLWETGWTGTSWGSLSVYLFSLCWVLCVSLSAKVPGNSLT